MTGPADAATITASEDDAADLAIACAEVAGVVLRLGPDGRVTLSAPQPPDETVLAGLRRHRDRITAMLAAAVEDGVPHGDVDHPDDEAERAAMVEHHAAPPDPCPWRPGDPDPLRDGLLAGWRASRSGRLAAIALRLEAARPRWAWGVREMDWRAWQTAAQEAAALPSVEWSSWRAKVGTAATAWPQRGTTDRNSLAHPGDHDP